MLDRKHEYEKMARVEQEHWWYRALHHLVLDSIRRNICGRDISIIDAGCGTGGLMLFLHQCEYSNLKGFDLSPDAIEICHQRRLNVEQDHLLNIAHRYPSESADVIVSNDTLCYLGEEERTEVVRQSFKVLRPGGLLILNLPALKAFRGIHDLSVGIRHRFSPYDARELVDPNHFHVISILYWPFLLSPLIYLGRLVQRIKMWMNPAFLVRSDIDLPNLWLNSLFERITVFENRLLPTKPFGSSLFLVLRKKTEREVRVRPPGDTKDV